MHITIFEENNFLKWYEEKIENHEESIIRRACKLLLSVTSNKQSIKKFAQCEPLLFDNLDLVSIRCETVEDSTNLYNTCLVDKCFTILYDDTEFEVVCKKLGVKIDNLEFFFNRISSFITDAVIIEWKLSTRLPFSCIKVDGVTKDTYGTFPISYYTAELISVVETLTGKKVKYTLNESSKATVTKDSIICYFTTERIESEYIICEQLLFIYLQYKGYDMVNNELFQNLSSWELNEETLDSAMSVVLQNQLINLIIMNVYPIFNNSVAYGLINFKRAEDSLGSATSYLCNYSKTNKFCEHCSRVNDLFSKEGGCPVYMDGAVMDRVFKLSELDTAEKMNEVKKELITNFLSKKD